MLAEHHMDRDGTLKLNRFSGSNKWLATASPARPTERSEKGTTAGVLVAAKIYLDTRPPSFANDPED